MFRIALTAVLPAFLLFLASAEAQVRQAGTVYKGRIKEVLGALGSLTLTVGEGRDARVQKFRIPEARIVGPTGSEWKVGDLRRGDQVEVRMTSDGRTVQEVRVLPDGANRRSSDG